MDLKISLHFNFLRPPVYVPKIDRTDTSLLSVLQKATLQMTYDNFLKHQNSHFALVVLVTDCQRVTNEAFVSATFSVIDTSSAHQDY